MDTPDPPAADDKVITAYYSLVFPTFTYYFQTLTATIGRRPVPAQLPPDPALVDVDLGPLKSVSRLHARIDYDDADEHFVLVVIGRNGAWVDGVWSPAGSRVPLGHRSQIQITSRTFHFVLPPAPPPDDTPSPTTASPSVRPRSPSVDIIDVASLAPSPRPTPPPVKTSPTLPKANGKPKPTTKKRKKPEPDLAARPKPEDMPPKPPFTYAQLCYRAIKALGGKGTLQEICGWIMATFDWYRFNEGSGWESSVRHNLSQNRAFQKLERSVGERGKGYLWQVDKECEHLFEDQELKQEANGAKSKKKDKAGALPTEPPFKRSIKGDTKGAPLPPPLTSTPLTFKSVATPTPPPPPPVAATALPTAAGTTVPPTRPAFPVNAAGTASPLHRTAELPRPTGISPLLNGFTLGNPPSHIPASAASPTISQLAAQSAASPVSTLSPSVYVPIVVGPLPASYNASTASSSSSAMHFDTPPIVLHENRLILSPSVFSHLTREQLKSLEALGAQKALEILRGYMVPFLKERIKIEGARGRGRGRGKRGRGAAAVSRSAGIGGTGGLPSGGVPDPPTGIDGSESAQTEGGGACEPLALPSPHEGVAKSAAGHHAQEGPVPMIVSEQTPVPPPITPSTIGRTATSTPPGTLAMKRSPSPFLVIDDDPVDTGQPALKKRRLHVGDLEA